MTAKDKAEKVKYHAESEHEIFEDYYTFQENEFREFCAQLCKEQREICRSEIEDETNKRDINLVAAIKEIVYNAPMPEL